MIPWAHSSPQPKQHLDRFSHICTTHHRESLYFTMGLPFPSLKIAPSHGWSGPHLIHGSLGPPESTTQTASRSVQPFLQGSLVWQTDRPTDHATRSVTVGRIYVHSTAMHPNNTKTTQYIQNVRNYTTLSANASQTQRLIWSTDTSRQWILYLFAIEKISWVPGVKYLLWFCLLCFDSGGWASGRASGLWKIDWWGAGVVVCMEWGAGKYAIKRVSYYYYCHHHWCCYYRHYSYYKWDWLSHVIFYMIVLSYVICCFYVILYYLHVILSFTVFWCSVFWPPNCNKPQFINHSSGACHLVWDIFQEMVELQ